MVGGISLLELLQNVLNAIDVGIVFIDADNKIVFFNSEAGEMLNEDPEKRIGTSVLLCHPKMSEQRVLQYIDEIRKGKRRVKAGILNYQGRHLEETFCPVFDDRGNYLGLIDLLHDAEEKVSLLKQLGKLEEIPTHVSGVGEKAPRRSDANTK